MGRQNKNLSNAFDRFSDNNNGNKIITPVHKQEQIIVSEQHKQESRI